MPSYTAPSSTTSRPTPSRDCGGSGLHFAARQLPVGPHEMTRVPVRIAHEVVLMLRLGFPERAHRSNLGAPLAGPQARRVGVRDRVLGDGSLRLVGVEDR